MLRFALQMFGKMKTKELVSGHNLINHPVQVVQVRMRATVL